MPREQTLSLGKWFGISPDNWYIFYALSDDNYLAKHCHYFTD